MRVLVGCEKSGVVRDAFRRRGHDAWSCDLRPTERWGQHLQCDVRSVLGDGWDLAIFHPECTYLTNSAAWAYTDGPYHQKVGPQTLTGAARREARTQAVAFVLTLANAPIGRIAIENPTGHLSSAWRKPDQIVHPHWFGDDASKATALWLKGLPVLQPTTRCAGRKVEWPRGSGKIVERWANQTDSGQNRLPPSEGRAAARGQTYAGIADAMSRQWG